MIQNSLRKELHADFTLKIWSELKIQLETLSIFWYAIVVIPLLQSYFAVLGELVRVRDIPGCQYSEIELFVDTKTARDLIQLQKSYIKIFDAN